MYQSIFYDSEKNTIHLWDDTEGYSSFRYRSYAFIEDDKGTFLTLDGKKVKKTFKWSENDETLGIVYEKDVNPEMRVLIDRYTSSDDVSQNHVDLFLDIEVSSEYSLPNVNNADNEITAISIYNRSTDIYTTFILDKSKKLENYKEFNKIVIRADSEEELLTNFFSEYISIKPTVITGWNIDNFDIPYLYNRSVRVLGDEIANMLSPAGIVDWSTYRERYRIAGVSCLDYLSLYRKFTYTQEPSYTLDAIAQKELGIGKIKYEGTLDNLYETNIDKFVEYNINDVYLVKQIDDKNKILDLVRGICHKGHVPYEDIYFSSRFLEGAMLVYMRKFNLVAPNKLPKDEQKFDDEKFSGAFVKPPQVGRYFWVYDLDMTSLYPSVIMTLNISPETKIGKLEGWDSGEYVKGTEKTYTLKLKSKTVKVTQKELEDIFSKGFGISSNGVLYNKETKGIIPSILESWFEERVEYKNLMKKYGDGGNKRMYEYFKARQHIQKILLNSLYGVLGLPSFRFYDLDNAEAVTTTGVTLIQYAEKMSNYFYSKELGENKDYCIYMDTDSLFFSALPLIEKKYPKLDVKNDVLMSKKILEVVEDIQKFVNSSFDLFSNKFLNVKEHRFSIKQELISKAGIWIAKKRYAQWVINDNGVQVDKLEVKGIDVVRSNFPIAFREFMKEILKDILHNEKKEKIDKKIISFKQNLSSLDLDKIAQPTSVKGVSKYTVVQKRTDFTLTKDFGFKNYEKASPAHVKASIMFNNLIDFYNLENKYQKISDNEKIRWVYLIPNKFGIDGLAFRGYDDPPQIIEFISEHIDYEKIFDSLFWDKIKDFYSVMNWSLPSETEVNLNNFFEY